MFDQLVRRFLNNIFEPKPVVQIVQIFVSATQTFSSNFENLTTKRKNVIRRHMKGQIDTSNPYFASSVAAYVISRKGGMSLEYLTENSKVPKIITSIARFYVYYNMKRFLQDPTKLGRFVTKEDLKVIQKNFPIRKGWETKRHYGKKIIKYWLEKQPTRKDIQNARYYGQGGKVLARETTNS